jgi:hypothetical protein
MQDSRVEVLVRRIAEMDRDALVRFLRGLDVDFTLDFTDEFLDSVTLEHLRHITLAAALRAKESVRD